MKLFTLDHRFSIRRREEIETVLQVPGLAVIPQIAPLRVGGSVFRARVRWAAAKTARDMARTDAKTLQYGGYYHYAYGAGVN